MAKIEDYIESLVLKDEAAFEAVYEETKHAVYALIVSIVKNKMDAEDIMQETYIKMMTSLHQYNRTYSFKTWLLTIAKHLAIDFYRKRKNIQVVDIETYEYITTSNVISAQDALEINEELNKMTDMERQIFILHIVDDMKHKDIAKLLNKPLGTVLWYYQKALKKIR
jgi:RNA polymerase sigma-70 factor (ECF subfamily)